MAQRPRYPRRAVFPWRGSLWQLLVITILPLAALTVMIAFGSLSVHQNAMRALVGERDQRAVKTAAAALEEQFNHRQDAIRSLSLMADASSPAGLSEILIASSYLLDDFDLGLAFFSPQGSLESSTGETGFWQGAAGALSDSMPSLLSPASPNVLITSDHSAGGNEKVVVVMALSPGGNWIAAGASTASSLVRHTISSSFASQPEASVLVVDAEKNVLYLSGEFNSARNPELHPGISEALRGESGVTHMQVGDSEHVVSYSPILSVGWGIVLEEPWETVDSPTLRATQLAPLVLVPVLGLALLGLWFGLRWIVQPLQELESKAAQLTWGEFGAIEQPVGGIAEIRRLQAELVHMVSKVKTAQQSLHSYIGAITTGQEEERRRLARELHDDTIQSLIALKQRVQLAMQDGNTAEPLAEVVTLTDQAIENVRRQTRALRPVYLEDLGLVTALEMLARETSQTAGIPVAFHKNGTEVRLNANTELALYRIAQEALNNVSRHAQAAEAGVELSFLDQEVILEVRDDGRGFEVPKSPAEFAPGGHFGLLGLHERAELIGARLEIHSTPGQGSRITVHLEK